ncbi:hypothetical protein CUMW_187000 [Citrus unshiu]|uniref:Leucine-rich repeat-containing N-terminal plant-type domain-containing protein n=1 Tax=Citrus unshiu TaxID=55188 RepID=A0A2H5Q1C4_CITUN|nr:hypothetical protein CUMW_187000 [Citrus unshiu]
MVNSMSMSCLAALVWCFSLLLLNSHSYFAYHSNETDRLALLAIKSQLQDPLGVTSSWNNSMNLCQWTGVTCGHRHPRVTALDLSNRSIGGTLSPFVGNLSFLRVINLTDNDFYGEIPNEVGKIPSNLSHCSNLINLFWRKNKLVGEISAFIGNWLKLEMIDVGDNQLIGKFPAFIANFSALEAIDISANMLGGRIPDSLRQLRSLNYLSISENNFSCKLPLSIWNISSLEIISLHLNRFEGSLPLNIGFNLPNVNFLSVGQNNFTGSLPHSLSNASNLQVLDELGQLVILIYLTLLTNCSQMEMLYLNTNKFGGVFPRSIANLSAKITVIDMGDNQISEYNQLTGTIPHAIGELKNLQGLALVGNSLRGTIPDTLGFNKLQGNVPSSLGNCQNLMVLSVSNNKLTGGLPPQILGIQTLSRLLDLSGNLLGGSIPLEVGMLSK